MLGRNSIVIQSVAANHGGRVRQNAVSGEIAAPRVPPPEKAEQERARGYAGDGTATA